MAARATSLQPRLREKRVGRRPRQHLAGLSLVEVMIVIAIMAMMISVATISIGALTKAELRSSTLRVVAASRFAYGRSVAHGSTVRMTLNFEDNTMALEETFGRIALASQADTRRVDTEEGDGAAVDAYAAARARLSKTFRPSLGETTFEPIRSNGSVLEQYQPRPIGDGVVIERLYVPHEPEPRETGRGAVYYFRGGHTEAAVIHLSDGSDQVFSVIIHPLTGRARVVPHAYEPEDVSEESFNEEDSEVRDDG